MCIFERAKRFPRKHRLNSLSQVIKAVNLNCFDTSNPKPLHWAMWNSPRKQLLPVHESSSWRWVLPAAGLPESAARPVVLDQQRCHVWHTWHQQCPGLRAKRLFMHDCCTSSDLDGLIRLTWIKHHPNYHFRVGQVPCICMHIVWKLLYCKACLYNFISKNLCTSTNFL